MCGIAFWTPKKVLEIFNNQTERGLDAVGIIENKTKKGVYRLTPVDPLIGTTKEIYTKTLTDYFKINKIKTNILLHHRKASMWGKTGDNAHPQLGKKFKVMQNGTSKRMRTWWDIELIHHDKSDTYCFLQYIERHCKNLWEVALLISIVPWTIGTIFVTDNKGQILFFSDKLREGYVDIVKEKINYIASKNQEDLYNEYYCQWYIIFTYDGSIIENQLTIINEIKPKPKTYPIIYTNEYPNTTRSKSTTVDSLFTDIDSLNYLLVKIGGYLTKKEYKIFPKAYKEFQTTFDIHSYDNLYKIRPDMGNEYMSERNYESKKWAKKYPTIIELLKNNNIQWGFFPYDKANEYWWYAEMRTFAKSILNKLEIGRIKKPIYYHTDIQPQTEITWFEDTQEDLETEYEMLQYLEDDYYSQQQKKLLPQTSITQPLEIFDVVIFEDHTTGMVYDENIIIYNNKQHLVIKDIILNKRFIECNGRKKYIHNSHSIYEPK